MAEARSRPAEGVLLMVVALLLIAVVDGFAKHLGRAYSPLFVAWSRYAVATLIVIPLTVMIHGRHLFPRERISAHILRTVFLVLAMTLYFVSIRHIELATAVSAYLVAPIVAVVLSVLVLKEPLTKRKMAALVLGTAGALVILRPGGTTHPAILLAFGCCVGSVLLTPQAIATWEKPAMSDLAAFAGLGAFSVAGHVLSIIALRKAAASTLAPIFYIELIGAALVGYFGFGEIPGPATIAGSVLIVVAGLVLLRDG